VKELNSLAAQGRESVRGAQQPSSLPPALPPRLPRTVSAALPRAGFSAQLTGLRVSDLVCLQNLAGASGVFLVISGDRSGLLHFARGQLFHAETREQRGDAAVLEILGWEAGEFLDSDQPLSGNASVSNSLDMLLTCAQQNPDGANSFERHPTSATGIRRRPLDSTRDLRAAATPGIAAAPAPRRTNRFTEGRGIASALVSPGGDLVDGHGADPEGLAIRVAFVSRLSELIGQAMGSGEARALRVRGADGELSIQRHPDGHLLGTLSAPETNTESPNSGATRAAVPPSSRSRLP
jgi:hypothetical protein